MCTVTWVRDPDEGYELFFNRDELLTRQEADGPRIHESGSVRFVAPIDGDFGGTWIAANERGLTVALLNGYRSVEAPSQGADGETVEFRSRGLLVVDLAGSRGIDELAVTLASVDLRQYRSFRLVVLAPVAQAWIAEWDRTRLLIEPGGDGRRPVISSSFEETEVGSRRRQEYERIVCGPRGLTTGALAEYHCSHEHGPSAFSVCMHRSNARTRSLTHVRVTANDVHLNYHAGSPCEPCEELAEQLARRD
jgi:hypothetical protein